MSATLMVIAIDIGTSYSSGFFSFKHDPTEIESVKEFPYEKVPSIVLFDKRKEFQSIGYEAVDHYKQLSDEEKRYWYYFKDFHKLSNEHKPTELEITESNGKRLETYTVYGSIIKYFTDAMFTKLRNADLISSNSDIYVVLIIPPVFARSHKSMLQKAFSYAGFNKNYSFVNESKAILSYWEHMWSDEQTLPKNVDLNNEIGFLLVNLKGSTALVSANSTKDGIQRRLAYVAGGGWGGQAVHEELKQFIIKIVGAPVFLRYIESYKGSTFDFKKYVANIFNRFGKGSEIKFRLPLCDLYETEFNESLKTAVKDSLFSNEVTVAGEFLCIKPKVFNGFFKNTLEAIVSNIKDILSDKSTTKIKVIVMVGYFSRIQLVQDTVKSAFPDCRVLVPSEPEFTLVKGATLTGHIGKIPSAHPKARSIVPQNTICAVVQHINDEREFPEFVKEIKKVLIEKGSHIQEGDKQEYNFTMDDICDMEHIDIFIFASPKAETCESASLNNDDVKIIRKERMNFNGAHTMNIKIYVTIYGIRWNISDDGGRVAIGFEKIE
ncbi:uncharacterized protein LOC132759639 [Ruditapes philippinarum]|uniref:uncharacterized protein LOC132759639 n=1 Tax=Ruditapes philippinarum TaxID=129788 RepID=UPI00295B1803|nr:uncharacterized protein LOC132759639 [Ruditapes philippinarum]